MVKEGVVPWHFFIPGCCLVHRYNYSALICLLCSLCFFFQSHTHTHTHTHFNTDNYHLGMCTNLSSSVSLHFDDNLLHLCLLLLLLSTTRKEKQSL